jgi:hypothetical protein
MAGCMSSAERRDRNPTSCAFASALALSGLIGASPGQAQEPFAVRAVEDLSIGYLDGPEEYTFGRVSALTVTTTGLIVVADEISKELRAYDDRGQHRWSLGREGAGPGEFQNLATLASRADTIVAFDLRLSRLTFINSDGRVVRTTTLPVHAGRDGFTTKIVPLSGGRFLSEAITGCRLPRVEGNDNKWILYLWQEGATTPITLQRQPRSTIIAVYGDADYRFCGTLTNPFGRTPMFGVGPDERLMVVDSSNGFVNIYSRFGSDTITSPDAVLRPASRPPAITRAERALFHDSVVARQAGAGVTAGLPRARARSFLAAAEALEIPHTWPAIVGLIVDDNGAVWLQRPLRFADPLVIWDRYVGMRADLTVSFPRAFSAREIAGEAAYGIMQDELGVQYIKRFAFSPAR